MFEKAFNFIGKYLVAIAAVSIVCMVVFPFVFTSAYVIRIVTVCMMYVAMALSLNLLTGYLGLMSMAHAAFWGIGAYTAAILATRAGWGMGMSMLAAMVATGVFGMLLGLPVLKLKGYYLTVVTLGFCEIVRLVEINEQELTRGPLGIPGIPSPNLFGIDLSSNTQIYFVMFVLLLAIVFAIYSIVHSRVGLGIMAIREDDLAAGAMGVNVFKYKVMVFIVSSMMVGAVGAFYAHYVTYIDPQAFTTQVSMDILIMAIFGGLGSIPGTVLGASLLTILPETMRGLMQYRNLLYGVLIVVMMMVKPEGLLGNINFKYIRQRLAQKKGEEKGAAS